MRFHLATTCYPPLPVPDFDICKATPGICRKPLIHTGGEMREVRFMPKNTIQILDFELGSIDPASSTLTIGNLVPRGEYGKRPWERG